MTEPLTMRHLSKRAIAQWGQKTRLAMLMEKSQLLAAIAIEAIEDGLSNKEGLADAVADLHIMLDQMRVLVGDDLVNQAIARKLQSMARRLDEHEQRYGATEVGE